MKKKPSPSQPSRRTFTKAAFTALASAPVVPSVIAAPGAQGSKSRRGGRQHIFTDHIPPLTLRGGSLSIELLHKLDDTSGGSGTRPERYVAEGIAAGTQYGSIARMLLVTENLTKSGSDYTGSFTLPRAYPLVGPYSESKRVELWLWFVNLPDSDTDPHMKIMGGYPVSGQDLQTLLIESDKKFDGKKTSNSHRKYKYTHKGHKDDEDYRIKRWRLVDGTTGRKIEEGSGGESYIMMIQFHHGVEKRSNK